MKCSTGFIKIFVYGTLLKGEHNHYLMKNSELLFYGKTKKQYTLYCMESFPGMVEGGNDSVSGEVYAVNPENLKKLDELEGHPDWYLRKKIQLENGEEVETYVLPESIAIAEKGVKIAGDWRKTKINKSFEETLKDIGDSKKTRCHSEIC